MKKIFLLYFVMIISSKILAAEQASVPMVTIVNKNRFFTLRHRLRALSLAIDHVCNIKISPDTGEADLPKVMKSKNLRIDVLRQTFLEDRWATLIFVDQILKDYEQTGALIIPVELLREITMTPIEYKNILEEENVLKLA